MDRELEYIKLKVDWYKSIYPWYLAILAGQVAFLRTIDVEEGGGMWVYYTIVVSILFLSLALVFTWQASLPLIHRLESAYEPNNIFLKKLLWTPQGDKWEAVFASLTGACFGFSISTFIVALCINVLL
ncbi:hypothetical protein HXW73_04605 [Halomonas sp. SH5A2]|uniref:hypothetical protein n=1 Tax=Halomonas sp. SH5A2 TaxID=2749040 RepID=UPI00163E4386|nr:hypothetical protein [Halomonas sp. SH5A2]QNI02274.1 hypothetical protein HXW73_04605 [Halomonas sp. SH5A2]